MADIALNNTAGGYYMSTNTNILGGVNTGTITTSSTESMFIIDGMSEIINPNYINTTKQWHESAGPGGKKHHISVLLQQNTKIIETQNMMLPAAAR